MPSRRTRDASEVDISWRLDAYKFELPFLSSPSDAVVSPTTASAIGELGGLGVLNLEGLWTRYEDPTPLLAEIVRLDPARATPRLQEIYAAPVKPTLVLERIEQIRASGAIACGALRPQRAQELAETLLKAELDVLVIQGTVVSAEHVARSGEPLNLKTFIRQLDIPIVVGGCSSFRTALHLMRTGAVGVLVGAGAAGTGSARSVLGIGSPEATAIADAAGARTRHLEETGVYVQVVADAAMRRGGDVAKAIACGADAVMLGETLARASDAAAPGATWGTAAWHATLPRGSVTPVLSGRLARGDPRRPGPGGGRRAQPLRCAAGLDGDVRMRNDPRVPALRGRRRASDRGRRSRRSRGVLSESGRAGPRMVRFLRDHRSDAVGVGWIVLLAILLLSPAIKDGHNFGPTDLGTGLSPGLTAGAVASQPHCLSVTGAVYAGCPHDNDNGDIINQAVPWNTADWQLVHHGQFPLWESNSGTGEPLLLNFESSVLALPTLVGYLVPLSWSFLVTMFVKLLIAGLGAYWCCRVLGSRASASAVGGAGFMFSGSIAGWLGWSITGPLVWTGAIVAAAILSYRRRRAVWPPLALAIAVAFSIFGGFPEDYALLAIALAALLAGAGLARARDRGRLSRSWACARLLAELAGGLGLGGALAARAVGPPVGRPRFSGRRHRTPDPRRRAAHRTGLQRAADGRQLLLREAELLRDGGVGHARRARARDLRGDRRAPPRRSHRARRDGGRELRSRIHARAGEPGPTSRHRSRVEEPEPRPGARAVGVRDRGARRDRGGDPARAARSSAGVRAALVGAVGLVAAAVVVLGVRSLGRWSPPPVRRTCGARRCSGRWGRRSCSSRSWWCRSLSAGGPVRRRGRSRRSSRSRSSLSPPPPGSSPRSGSTATATPRIRRPRRPTSSPPTSALALLGIDGELADHDWRQVQARRSGFRTWPTVGFYPNIDTAYGIDELALHDPTVSADYFAAWPVPNSDGVSSSNLFVPDVDTVALARRYGVGYILSRPGAPPIPGTVRVATIAGERLSKVPDSGRFTVADTPEPLRFTHPDDATYVVDTTGHHGLLTARITASPGWHATADGRSLPITRVVGATPSTGVFLSVTIPTGASSVTFHYSPPHLDAALALGGRHGRRFRDRRDRATSAPPGCALSASSTLAAAAAFARAASPVARASPAGRTGSGRHGRVTVRVVRVR